MTTYTRPFCLSTAGSTRATAYNFGNKVVTLNGKTHVVWLDAVSRVCGRTYDHASGSWGDTVPLFEGYDNHTNPSLAADADSRLHLAYGPHGWFNWNGGCFKHVISTEPDSLDAWENEVSLGYNATYACLATTPSGLDCIVYRGGDPPSQLMFQRQRSLGGWEPARGLMRQEIPPQYTNVGATVVCDPDGVLFAAGHFFNLNTDARSAGVAILKSIDMGETWTDLSGEGTDVPILLTERFAVPHKGEGDVRLAGLSLDRNNRPWVATTTKGCAQVSYWTGSEWDAHDLGQFLPQDRIAEAGPIVVDTANRLHMATAMNLPAGDEKPWGHPNREVFHLVSSDGGQTFECNRVSTPDDRLANWLPSISQSGVHQPVENPTILYTHGVPGKGCLPPDTTEVYAVFVDTHN